ncbi:MAG: hypothetical protein WC485_01880 [Opitutaceae bacterium]
MAVKTTLEQLEEVQAAITACLTSQELSGPHGTVVRARLEALTAREQQLLKRYEEEQAAGDTGGFINRVQFGRPT